MTEQGILCAAYDVFRKISKFTIQITRKPDTIAKNGEQHQTQDKNAFYFLLNGPWLVSLDRSRKYLIAWVLIQISLTRCFSISLNEVTNLFTKFTSLWLFSLAIYFIIFSGDPKISNIQWLCGIVFHREHLYFNFFFKYYPFTLSKNLELLLVAFSHIFMLYCEIPEHMYTFLRDENPSWNFPSGENESVY